MDMLKKFFPTAFKATDVKAFIIALIIYVLIDVVCGFVIGLLVKIPVIGIIFSLVGSLVGLYALIGVVLPSLCLSRWLSIFLFSTSVTDTPVRYEPGCFLLCIRRILSIESAVLLCYYEDIFHLRGKPHDTGEI